MTARSVSDLAADVRAAIRPRGPIAGESRLRQSERDKVAKADAALAELEARLKAVEARQADADDRAYQADCRAIDAEAQVAALTAEVEEWRREWGTRDDLRTAAESNSLAAQVAALTQELEGCRHHQRALIDEANRWTRAYEKARDEVAALTQERERDKRKVEAYDAARATVKVEGNTRAYYVLRAEAAEAALAAITDTHVHEWVRRARETEAALAEYLEEIKQLVRSRDMYVRQRDEARTSLADTRRALEQILGPSPTRTTTTDQAPEWVRSIARRALAAADGGLTAPPMDLGGLVDDAEVANKIDRRAATGGGQEQQP